MPVNVGIGDEPRPNTNKNLDRLAEEVCEMDGLSSADNRFIIVQGSGLPRLGVVGFNRRVDWPTLVQRLVDVTQGDSKPVFE